jgi:hypothetical protein
VLAAPRPARCITVQARRAHRYGAVSETLGNGTCTGHCLDAVQRDVVVLVVIPEELCRGTLASSVQVVFGVRHVVDRRLEDTVESVVGYVGQLKSFILVVHGRELNDLG